MYTPGIVSNHQSFSILPPELGNLSIMIYSPNIIDPIIEYHKYYPLVN